MDICWNFNQSFPDWDSTGRWKFTLKEDKNMQNYNIRPADVMETWGGRASDGTVSTQFFNNIQDLTRDRSMG